MKIHVFVDSNQNIVSITPAPTSSVSSKLTAREEEITITFGGSEPAQKTSRWRRYELDSEVDLSIDLNQFEVSQLHQRAIDVIKARPDLRSIELS